MHSIKKEGKNVFENDILAHHGIIGQKWGVRRYQYEDGTLTPAGKERYGVGDASKTSNKQSNSNSSNRLRSSSSQSNSGSDSYEPNYRFYGGGGAAEEDEEDKKKKVENAIDELEDSLLDFFDGNDNELYKYVTISRNFDDPSQSMFIIKDPITKTQAVFKPDESGKMLSYLSKKVNEAAATLPTANKRTAAAQRQDVYKRAEELAKKTEAWKEQGSARTAAAQKQDRAIKAPAELARKRSEAAQKQDAARKAAELKEAAQKRTAAAQKQDRAVRTPIENAKKRTAAAQKQDEARKAAEKAARQAEFLAKENEKIRILKEKGKELEAKKRTEAAKKQDAAKKKSNRKVSHSEEYIDQNDILMHYGVLGMKWGIRRYQNEDGTLTELGKQRVNKKYSRGVNKLERIDRKVQKLNTKKNKMDEKLRKFDYKANRAKIPVIESWKGYEKRLARKQIKLESKESKYRKLDWKSEKVYNKGAKWVKKMDKKFKDIDLSSANVSQSDIDYVNSYLSRILEDSRRASHGSDRRSASLNNRSSRK